MTPIALDTNVLVKVMREEDAGRPTRCARCWRTARQQGTTFAVPVFCVGEFWRIVTDRRAGQSESPPIARWRGSTGLLSAARRC